MEIKKNGHSWTQHKRRFVTVVRSLIYAAICAIVTSPTMELDGELQKKIFYRIPNLDIFLSTPPGCVVTKLSSVDIHIVMSNDK